MGLVEGITHEPDDKCPVGVSVSVGLQGVLLAIAPTVLTMSLFARASGLGERYLAWSVLAAIMIGGIATALQAARLGRLGGGHNLVSGTASGFVAVGLVAVNEAGLETLTTLVVVSSVLQLALGGVSPEAAPDHHAGCLRCGAHADLGWHHAGRRGEAGGL